MIYSRVINTLAYDSAKCINCGVCLMVCPHAVFAADAEVVQLARPQACIECGACQRNCPVGAITVQAGVGCAEAMIRAALRPKKSPARDAARTCE